MISPILTRRPVTPGTVDTLEEVYEVGNLQLIFLADSTGWTLTQETDPDGESCSTRTVLAEGVNNRFSYENPDYVRIDHMVMGHIHDIQTKWFSITEARTEYQRVYDRFTEVLGRINIYEDQLNPKRLRRVPTAQDIEHLENAVVFLDNSLDPLDEVEDPDA